MRRVVYFILLCLSASSFADVLEPLNFGTLVIAKNDRVSSVKLPTNHAMSSNNDIHIMERGHPARLVFEGLPANTLVNISSSSTNVELKKDGFSPVFVIAQLLYQPTLQSNVYGEIELVIGAILQTSGTGTNYTDGEYRATVDIELSY